MDNKSVSSWIRQARYRASKKNLHSDIEISDIQLTVEQFDGKCAYCDRSKDCWGMNADALDHAFNLSEESSNVPANVIPVCKKMKAENKSEDVASLLSSGKIHKDAYLKIVEVLLPKRGGDKIRRYIRSIMGF